MKNRLKQGCFFFANYTVLSFQIAELTSQIACLEIGLNRQKSKNEQLENELVTVKELCTKLDQQKDSLSRQLAEQSGMKIEMDRLRRDSNTMRETLMKDRNNVEYLETLLSESRQEAVNLKLVNQELQTEIQRLRSKAEELQSKL